MLLSELRGESRGEENIIMWMPLEGQVNTLKGKQTERKRGQKLVFGRSASKWGLGERGSRMQICHSRCVMKEMVNAVLRFSYRGKLTYISLFLLNMG